MIWLAKVNNSWSSSFYRWIMRLSISFDSPSSQPGIYINYFPNFETIIWLCGMVSFIIYSFFFILLKLAGTTDWWKQRVSADLCRGVCVVCVCANLFQSWSLSIIILSPIFFFLMIHHVWWCSHCLMKELVWTQKIFWDYDLHSSINWCVKFKLILKLNVWDKDRWFDFWYYGLKAWMLW